MSYEIRHEPEAQHFAVVVDGYPCVLDYRLRDGVMRILHTGVPDAVGGRGIAAALTRTAFETARANGWKVEPACSYSQLWLQRNPAFEDLIVRRP